MALYINTNVASLEAQEHLASTQRMQSTNYQRLSSGLRINSSADDAAGLAVATSMNAQVSSLSVAQRNSNNAISMAQTADGALGQVSDILSRMRDLAVQGANGDLNAGDRGNLDTEFSSLRDEITRISGATTFNGKALLSGASAATTFQVGITNTTADHIDVTFGGVDTTTLGIGTSSLAGATATGSQTAIDDVDTAIAAVSTIRAGFGASMNRLQSTVSNLESMSTNMSAAVSRIQDVDVASETAAMSRNSVLSQAAVSVLSQANQAPQLALKLLQ